MADLTFEEYCSYSPYYIDFGDRESGGFAYKTFLKDVECLPPNVKSFFLKDFETAEYVKKVITENKLSTKEGEEIARIIKNLLFINVYLGNIVEEIKNRLNIDEQKAKIVAGLIVAGLFAPILEDLKKMHIQKFAKNIPKPQNQSNQNFDDRVVDLKNSGSKF